MSFTYGGIAVARVTFHGLGGGVAFCQFGGEVGGGHDAARLPHYGDAVGCLSIQGHRAGMGLDSQSRRELTKSNARIDLPR